MTLKGNELVSVTGISATGYPSGSQEQCTTQDIANLAGSSGLTQIELNGATSGTTIVKPQTTASGTLTLPSTTSTLAAIGLAQTWSAAQTFGLGSVYTPNTPVAATGSGLSTAAQLLNGWTLVTASDSTKCVKLPAVPTPGMLVVLFNSVAAEPLIVFPDAAATINAIASHGAYTAANGVPLMLYATSATQWYTLPLLGS